MLGIVGEAIGQLDQGLARIIAAREHPRYSPLQVPIHLLQRILDQNLPGAKVAMYRRLGYVSKRCHMRMCCPRNTVLGKGMNGAVK